MIEKGLFISLLKSALWGSPVDGVPSQEELMAAVRHAKAQSVLGLVADVILADENLYSVLSDDQRRKLKHFVIGNFSTSQMLNNALLNVVEALRQNGVDPVLLKGQGIAKYYPKPELRQCGDIDIYVGQDYFQLTCEVIGAMSSDKDKEGDIPSTKHYHTRIGKAFFEIHRYTDVYFPPRLDRIYQRISDDGMSKDLVTLDFAGVPVLTPSIDFNIFFIFNHFWHHFIADGVGLRQICDWVLLLHHNYGKVNLDYLETVLYDMKLMKQWQVFGNIAVDFLGLPPNEMPFYNDKYKVLSEKVLKLIMIEGNFGKENLKGYNRPKGYFAGKFYSLSKRVQRNYRVFRLFPRDAFMHLGKVFCWGIAAVFNDKFRLDED